MTRPLQRFDVVRDRVSGRVGRVDMIAADEPLCSVHWDDRDYLCIQEVADLELYDVDEFARPIRRFLACIAMAAAMKASADQAASRVSLWHQAR